MSAYGTNTYLLSVAGTLQTSGSNPAANMGTSTEYGIIFVPNGAEGSKGEVGADSITEGPKGEPSDVIGPHGPKGEPGFDFEYEHVALNPVARDEVVTSAGIAKAFVKVPTSIDSSNYYLHSIESSWGTTANTALINFKLKKVDSAGNATDVYSWQHAGATYYDTALTGITTIDNLGGQYIYIEHTDGALTAYGYSATLIWKRK
jgi:hypothetical protein